MLKCKVLFFIIFIYQTAFSNEQTAKKLFEEGNLFYKTKNFSQAIQKYEQIENLGYQSAEVYVNLGNSYYQKNQIGQAIYNYHKALKIEPTLSEAYVSLEQANSKTKDQINDKANLNLIDAYHFLCQKINNIVFIILGFLFSLCITILYYKKRTLHQKWIYFFMFILIIVIGSLLINFSQNQKIIGVVLQPEIAIYEDENFSKEATKLHSGTTFEVLSVKYNVAHIQLSNNKEYFVRLDTIKVVDNS